MISLFVDTSYHDLVISLFSLKKEIYHISISNNNDLSTNLLKEVEKAFQECGISTTHVEKVFIVTGPGSFTGLRIGLAFAKTFAWSIDTGIIEISELELLASSKTDKKYIVPLMDARRDAVYGGMYDQNLNSVIPDCYMDRELFLEKVKEISSLDHVLFVSYDEFSTIDVEKPVIDVSKVVLKHYNDSLKNPHTVVPNYLKKTEAEEKRENDSKN
jgi:tRNA threonylcarbamoyl adenosine modification protein YeaZ